ncbi:MAG: hypothetical protein P8185_02235 [Deltaproteobacteria bacterium]|jgi:hypothetical protein
MDWIIEPVKRGRIAFQMVAFFIAAALLYTTGCSSRYFMYKDTLTTELVTFEDLPHYNKVTVCQGPAILYLPSEILFCIVRCYDSNSDAQMLSLKEKGIDVFEYRLAQTRKYEDGQFYPSIAKFPHMIIADLDFDGIGDFIYLFRISTTDAHLLYEKINIGNHHLVMNDFSPARFRLSDFKSDFSLK